MKQKRISLLVPTLYLLLIFSITVGLYFTKKAYDGFKEEPLGEINYVSSSIFSRSVPIINVPDLITSPFSNQEVTIQRYFYNQEDDAEQKEKSVVFYNGTYMPNTGIDYVFGETFDVLSIYEGTVIDVSEDEFLGKSVKVRHNNEVISVYQGLGQVEVNKGDVIFLGQKIGTSGTNKLNESLGNHLHLEIYKNGEVIDPLKCIGQKLGDI